MILSVFVFFILSPPVQAEIKDGDDAFLRSRPVVSPGFYWLWGRGNCVWFAWECAWQKYGVRLPWAGDAKNWTRLAGQEVRAVDGTVYRLELSDEPEPDSIMVVQPDPADNSPYSQLGHVAWVFQYIEDEEGWGLVGVLESTVYPPPDWGTAEINGCVYRKIYYFWRPGSNTKKFLVFRERGDLAT